MNEELIREQIAALNANTAAMQEYTKALNEHTAALHEQADAQKKLERTLHLIFEDNQGYINGAADSKIRGLRKIAEEMQEAAHKMDTASKRFADSGRRGY